MDEDDLTTPEEDRPPVEPEPSDEETEGGVPANAGPDDPVCVGCGRRPSELQEYVDRATPEEGYASPAAVVVHDEGTYNPRNGHFLCTPCYIAAGMPTAPGGWKAP